MTHIINTQNLEVTYFFYKWLDG